MARSGDSLAKRRGVLVEADESVGRRGCGWCEKGVQKGVG